MNGLLLYLLKSSLCLSVLFAVYWLFLRRDTFFQVNRFYLLAAVIFSMLAPLVPFSWTMPEERSQVMVMLEPVLITPEKVIQTLIEHLQWIEVAGIIYFTGTFIFFLRLVVQLIQIHRITKRFGVHNRHGRSVVFVDEGYSPFSFFNLVYINDKVIPDDLLPTVLDHEAVHIKQRHTLDMILIELATIFQWFNPVIWYAAREMKTIHEYLADEGVLQNGISRSLYQQMILNETMGIQVNNLTNNFNVSLLKKRIAMMTKSKSGSWARSKILMALPVMMLLGVLFTAAGPQGLSAAGIPDASVYSQADLLPHPDMLMQDQKKQTTQVKYVAPVVPGQEVFPVVEKQPSYNGGQDAMIKFLIENIQYPPQAKANKVQGTVFVTFVVEVDGAVSNVKVLRGIGSGCDEEAARVVKMMPNWNPGEQKGKPVRVQFNLPIKFKLDSKKKEESTK
jgi:TonB family protein